MGSNLLMRAFFGKVVGSNLNVSIFWQKVVGFNNELPMGIASQNRFWLFKRLPSCEDSNLQFLGH